MSIQNNKNGSGFITLNETANANYLLSDFASSNNETVHALTIVEVSWSGNSTVSRGANTVLNLSGYGQWKNIVLSQDRTANLQITTAGTINIVLHKQSSITNTEY